MDSATLKSILDRAQYDYLPLICSSLVAVLVLTLFRDIFTREQALAAWVIAYYLVWFALIVVVLIARQSGKIPVHWGHVLALLCLSGFLLNPTVAALQGILIGPMYFAASLFAGGLVCLSIPPLLIAQVAALAIWIVAVGRNYELGQLVPTLLMALMASGFALFMLQRRIATIVRIFRLESRVEALESILPMCSGCKKTRDEDGNWLAVEDYIENQEEGLQVSHGLCPDCKEANYGDFLRKRAARQEHSDSAS
ncbi:MAG: hypothetical protein MRY76_13475 [Pseudomonadales bacterium]|nr:hypothetical protein [Pseudomonadales bacterium]